MFAQCSRKSLGETTLNKRLRYLHKLRGDLRERFRYEYLRMLIQKGKEKDSHVKVGDVVLAVVSFSQKI